MDSVFFEKPVLLLFFAAEAALHFLLFKMQNNKKAMHIALLNIAFHSAALCVLLISGASIEDALLFVLFSLFLSLVVYRGEARKNSERHESENENEENREDGGK